MYAVAPQTLSHTGQQPPADWRDAELEVFRVLQGCLDGRLPNLGDSSDAARRAGYLAEFAALLLGAKPYQALMEHAARLHACLVMELGPASAWPPLAAVPGGLPRRSSGLDQLAARWGICPAIDRNRFLAERHRLGASLDAP